MNDDNNMKDNCEEGVSPVIATILMVAITVVLSGVLYVWASELSGNQIDGGSLNNYTVEDAYVLSEDGKNDALLRLGFQFGQDDLKWSFLTITLFDENSGKTYKCSPSGEQCSISEENEDDVWSGSEIILINEQNTDICNSLGLCELKVTIQYKGKSIAGNSNTILVNIDSGVRNEVIQNDCVLGFMSSQMFDEKWTNGATLGDIDNDGDLDIVFVNGGVDNPPEMWGNTFWINHGDDIFTKSEQEFGNANSLDVALGDLNGNGYLDIVVANYGDSNGIWLNDKAGNFYDAAQLGNSNSYSVDLGDIDGDNDLDVVFTNINGINTIWLNDGLGVFSESEYNLGDGDVTKSVSVALGDLDGDGDLDAMITNGRSTNTVWINDGVGIFTDSGQELGTSDSREVVLGDLDMDGDLDAIFAKPAKPDSVWINDGAGIFTDSGQELGDNNSRSVVLGDIDMDGDLDAVFANSDQPNYVWINDGFGNFINHVEGLGNNDSRVVVLGDIDLDGDLDIIVANRSNQPNTTWINNCTSE